MADDKIKRGSFPIQLDASQRQALEEIVRRTGMTKKALIEHVLTWFARQPQDAQAVILGHVARPTGGELLRRLAEVMDTDVLTETPPDRELSRLTDGGTVSEDT